MIVHFVAPSSSYKQKRGIINLVQDTIKDQGCYPTRSSATDSATMIEMGAGMLDNEDWELVCRRDLELLTEADVAIFEVSDKATFGVGYLAAHMLMLNRPALFLMAEGSLQGSFTTGLKHPKLTRKIYNDKNIKSIVTEFLEAYKK